MPKVADYSKYAALEADFDEFMTYRQEILKALEEARTNKVIGKSFAAKLTLTLDDHAEALFKRLNANIAQILIVSQYEEVKGDSFKASVKAADTAVRPYRRWLPARARFLYSASPVTSLRIFISGGRRPVSAP